jgi:hypothetical protein
LIGSGYEYPENLYYKVWFNHLGVYVFDTQVFSIFLTCQTVAVDIEIQDSKKPGQFYKLSEIYTSSKLITGSPKSFF